MLEPTHVYTLSFKYDSSGNHCVSFSQDESLIGYVAPYNKKGVLRLFLRDGNNYSLIYSYIYDIDYYIGAQYFEITQANQIHYLVYFRDLKSRSFVHEFNIMNREFKLLFQSCKLYKNLIFDLSNEKQLKIINLRDFPAQQVTVLQNIDRFYSNIMDKYDYLIVISGFEKSIYTLPDIKKVSFMDRINLDIYASFFIKSRPEFIYDNFNDLLRYESFIYYNTLFLEIIEYKTYLGMNLAEISREFSKPGTIRIHEGYMSIQWGRKSKLIRNLGDCFNRLTEQSQYVISSFECRGPGDYWSEHYIHNLMTAERVSTLENFNTIFTVSKKYIFEQNDSDQDEIKIYKI